MRVCLRGRPRSRGAATQPPAAATGPGEGRSAPAPGSVLHDRYELGQVIGCGGMSTVHRAYDRRSGQDVAVKIPRPTAEMIEADIGTRREVDLLSALDDPGLVAVVDGYAGDGSAPAYLVTELVDGPTLAQWIRHTTLTEQQTARLGAAMCRTLAYVHARGIVHRDVKPANILITGESEADLVAPKLADFGIATSVSANQVAATGVTVGTANYVSPEQVRGDGLTPATDVYSLGLVLIEALTGVLAYPGTGVEAAMARLNRSAIVPRDVSRGLRAVLAGMTAPDPVDRPDAGRAAAMLDEIAVGSDGSLADEILMLGRSVTDPDEPPGALASRARRRRVVPAVAAAVVIAGCAALTANLGSTGSAPPRPASHAGPRAASSTVPPSRADPTQAAPPRVSPALRRTPAPRTASQLAAIEEPRDQQAGTHHLDGTPKHHRKDTGRNHERAKGKVSHGKSSNGRHSKSSNGRHSKGRQMH